jgi:tetratricopeptide (TPR) repeat protein
MRLTSLVLLALATAVAQSPEAREQGNLGVTAYKNAQYPLAATYFAEAIRLDPEYVTARLYLGTTYMSQYIPGADNPENAHMAELAEQQFQAVLDRDAANHIAVVSLASLYYHQKKFDDAKRWYEKMTLLSPDNKESWYTLGVIAWSKWYPVYAAARTKTGMKPEDPGPIADEKVRQDLKMRFGSLIDEGIRNLERALKIDSEYDDAMAYMNLLVRERADLLDSRSEYLNEIQIADDWVQKALATKKKKAEARAR